MSFEPKKHGTIITTKDLDAPRAFYEKHFDFEVIFDHENYVQLASRNRAAEISFMKPESDQCTVFSTGGITFYLEVEDVDQAHARIVEGDKLEPIMPLSDQPWGDRSFAILDPAGVAVYVCSPIEPSKEFADCFKG